jgi:hypothetical protein
LHYTTEQLELSRTKANSYTTKNGKSGTNTWTWIKKILTCCILLAQTLSSQAIEEDQLINIVRINPLFEGANPVYTGEFSELVDKHYPKCPCHYQTSSRGHTQIGARSRPGIKPVLKPSMTPANSQKICTFAPNQQSRE